MTPNDLKLTDAAEGECSAKAAGTNATQSVERDGDGGVRVQRLVRRCGCSEEIIEYLKHLASQLYYKCELSMCPGPSALYSVILEDYEEYLSAK